MIIQPPIKPILPYRLPKPYIRHQEAKAMTIAAGFRCVNGVVLAADTEISLTSENKSQDSKIMAVDMARHCWMAYAGITPFAKEFADVLRNLPSSLEGHKLTIAIKTEFELFVKKHFLDMPEKGQTFADCLITVREGERVNLYAASTLGCHFVKVTNHETFGTGQSQGEAIFHPIHFPAITVEDAVHLAIYAFRRAKNFSGGVGGTTEAIWIKDDWSASMAFALAKQDAAKIEEDFDMFDRQILDILCNLPNPRIDEKSFARSLQSLTKNLKKRHKEYAKLGDQAKKN
jgi:hypothetical protein